MQHGGPRWHLQCAGRRRPALRRPREPLRPSGCRQLQDREEEYYAEPGVAEAEPVATEDVNSTDSLKSPKVNCEERNVTGLENLTLKILNMSQDLMDFLNPNGSDCTLVLFYTPWCRFSATLAPHFNSLPCAFPTLGFLALDASQHSSLSTRFGTVAIPNILLFQGAKPMARFNHTDQTLKTLKIFIFNQTGIEAKKNVVVTQADQMGPLPSMLIKTVDWLLVFSLFFLISFIMYATIRTESIRWLIPGQEQEHAETELNPNKRGLSPSSADLALQRLTCGLATEVRFKNHVLVELLKG